MAVDFSQHERQARDVPPEYAFSSGVQGKCVARLATGSNVIVLERDVQKMLSDSATVNAASTELGEAVEISTLAAGPTRPPSRAHCSVLEPITR